MSTIPRDAATWKWCALTCVAMLVLSLIPQLHLWLVRGREWNGAYVSPQGDEPLYSAYVNALIDGRTRKNDPYAAKDSTLTSPLPESTFSIQFIPPYVISFLARLFGASAATAMIALLGATGLLATLSVFWLLNSMTWDVRIAAAGTLFVLCLGGLAGEHGLLGLLLKDDLSIPSLPFLRRYQPAAPFFLFFVFNALVWQALTSERKRSARLSALLAGLTLAVLIFSYLYLWTAAAAWLACIGLLWLYFRPTDRRRTLEALAIIGVITGIALIPYGYLVSHRSPSLDEEQALVLTRQLDLFRIPEILGVFILMALFIGIWRGRTQANQPRAIYAASLALLPFVLFNQQVLTGRSMQPHHFAHFIVNYAVLVGAVSGVTLLWKTISTRVLVWTAALFFSWGVIEVALPARLATVSSAITRDQMVPV